MTLTFEWNENKSQGNSKKHGITFEEAKTVFNDTFAITIDDPDHSDEENRFLLLGVGSGMRMLVVCHCYRETDEVIRLISARKGDRRERQECTTIAVHGTAPQAS